MNLNDMELNELESSCEEQLRIPVVMVLLVLIVYTAIGGLLYQKWENWEYFDAFYFCFITMATVGKLLILENLYLKNCSFFSINF